MQAPIPHRPKPLVPLFSWEMRQRIPGDREGCTKIGIVGRAILKVLERAQPYALPEAQLGIELKSVVLRPPGNAKMEKELRLLETRGYIVSIPDPLDARLSKWSMPQAGRTMRRD